MRLINFFNHFDELSNKEPRANWGYLKDMRKLRRKKKVASTKDSSEFFQTILNTIPGYVSWISSDLVYLGVNDALAKKFGISKTDLIGKKLGFKNQQDDFVAKVIEFFNKTTSRDSFEICLQVKEEKHWQLVEAQKYNKNTNAIFIGIDITEKKKMESSLKSEQELRAQNEKMASLGEMAAGIAHEIKSPLSAIIGNAELILLNKDNVDKVKNFSEKIQNTCDRINKIIKSLQTYSRNGSQDPFRPTHLRNILDDALELCTEKFRSKKIEFSMGNISPDFCFDCRAGEIVQILLNLFKNAVDAIEKSPTRWIRVDFLDLGKNFQISVTDSGNGIPKEIQEKMTRPFFTTKVAGEGTGIGFNLSKRIAENHSGELKIDSSCPNTRFLLILPKKQNSIPNVA